MTAKLAGLFLDYSKNRVTDETIRLLLQLAEESGLRSRMDAMFRKKLMLRKNARLTRRTARAAGTLRL